MPHRSTSRRSVRQGLLYVGIILLGVVVGVVWLLSSKTTYTGEYRMAIGESNVSAAQVPGYAVAEQQLASNYARLLTDTDASRKAASPDGGAIVSVTASPIPESSIIRVEVEAATKDRATKGAEKAAENLRSTIDSANGNVDDAATAFRTAYVDYVKAKTATAAAKINADTLLSTLGPSSTTYQNARGDEQRASAADALANLKQVELGDAYQTAFTNAKNARVTMLGAPGAATSGLTSRIEKNVGIPVVVAIAVVLLIAYRRRIRIEREELLAHDSTVA